MDGKDRNGPAPRIPPVLHRIAAEMEIAEALCESILDAPPQQWAERVGAIPEARTPFMVVQLLERMPALLEQRPGDALQLTALAVAIAESLHPRDSWEEGVILARGQALREHAYVLSCLGRDREALQYVERAERELAQVPADGFELARLALVKAGAVRLQGRTEEAIALARQAARTFREIDEPVRAVDARITEGAILYEAGAIERALEVWTALRGDPGLTEVSALRIAHNIAVCLCDLGRPVEAVEPLEQGVEGFTRAGLLTERTRGR